MWKVKALIPNDIGICSHNNSILIEDVPGDTEAEAVENAENYLRSTGEYDPWDIDKFHFLVSKMYRYNVAEVELWKSRQ